MNAPTREASQKLVLDSVGGSPELADLLIAVFEQASQLSQDPDEVARIATEATIRLLRDAKSSGGDC